MITVNASSIGNIDRKAITVTFDIDTQFTCDIVSQILVTVNGNTVVPDSVVLSNPKRMGILLPDNIMIGDVVEWFYYSGACRLESVGTNTELLPHATAFPVTNHITSDLILYPAMNADSFVTVLEADDYIATLTLHSTEWMALSVADKEIYLRIAYRLINAGIDYTVTPLPAVLPTCLYQAQALIALHDLTNGISANASGASSSGVIKKQKVASLEVEYFEPKDGLASTTTNPIPTSVRTCLSGLGYTFSASNSGMKQARVGRM